MHEIGVLSKAIDMVEEVALHNGVESVKYVTLEIGELSGYLPIFFEKYFPIVTDGKKIFHGTKLRMDIVRGEALCTECQSLYNVMKNEGKCPSCGSREKKILGGQQFIVKDIGY